MNKVCFIRLVCVDEKPMEQWKHVEVTSFTHAEAILEIWSRQMVGKAQVKFEIEWQDGTLFQSEIELCEKFLTLQNIFKSHVIRLLSKVRNHIPYLNDNCYIA